MTDLGPRWPDDARTRWSRRALWAASRLVPYRRRRDWFREWEAELWQLRCGKEAPMRLAVFLAGAIGHGMWEWREEWRMDTLLQDIRYAVRTLARSPGFTAAAVLLLATGIGANTALFSVLEQAVLGTPPFLDPDELVVVDNLFGRSAEDMQVSNWSYPRYRALRDEIESIDDPAGYGTRTATLTELGDPTTVSLETVTPSYFSLLGVDAARGRVFGPDEVDNGSANLVALVSDRFWRTRLGAAPDVVGRIVTLDRIRLSVLGVLPPRFDGLTGEAELWIPLSALREFEDESALADPWNQYFNVVARLDRNATLESAQAEVRAFGATFMERFPPPEAASLLIAGADVVPYREARVNPVAEASMFALFGAVALMLLVATANLAGLLLARGANRQREAAVRAALGAGRTRLLRQLLTESLTLAFLGGTLGVAVAWIGVDVLGVWLTDAVGTGGGRGLEYLNPDGLSLDWPVLGFAVLLTGGVGIVCGIFPAWQAARIDPGASLMGGGASLGSRPTASGLPGRSGLVVVQVGVAIVLLAGATLMMRTLANLQRVDLGYDPDRLLTAMYGLTPADEEAGVDPATFHVDFLERVRALPGVVGATLGEVPRAGPTWRTIVMGSDGRPDIVPTMHMWIRMQAVADGHLGVMGADLIEGRDIEESDGTETEKVVVLNRTAASVLFPDANPIGRMIQLGPVELRSPGTTVVGIVDDLQYADPGEPSRASGIPVRTTGAPGSPQASWCVPRVTQQT